MLGRGGMRTYSVVNMHAKFVGLANIAVEQGWVDRFGQRPGDEHRVARQGAGDDVACLLGFWQVFGQLKVVFDGATLAAGGDPAIGPVRRPDQLTDLRQFFGHESLGNAKQHE